MHIRCADKARVLLKAGLSLRGQGSVAELGGPGGLDVRVLRYDGCASLTSALAASGCSMRSGLRACPATGGHDSKLRIQKSCH